VFILVDNADMQQDRDIAKHILNNMELADRIGCSNFTQSQSIGGSHHDAASSAGQNMLAGMTISQRLQRWSNFYAGRGGGGHRNQNTGLVPVSMLRRYIEYATSIQPILSKPAAKFCRCGISPFHVAHLQFHFVCLFG
jgi:DNA replicative helicase MCM subunit Mcm2 (Cdc46/Mcm family)